GISDSASWAAHAGWVKSPVPTTVTPFRAPHQARCGISESLLQAREYREWICESAWNTPPDPATWRRSGAGIRHGLVTYSGAGAPAALPRACQRRAGLSRPGACSAPRPVMGDNAGRGIRTAKEEAPA